ncbi:MAG TPA: tetratricopeptide repeat protein [Polyangiaceae bacterium]|jgi:hypothetical protein
MDRSELERLDRDTLIARAEASGVPRPRILTRPELVDELLVRGTEGREDVQRVRGFFGRARDLLARVVERGLHLPDAAERLRVRAAAGAGGPVSLRSAASPLPTLTLAEIYAAQGHRERALQTLEDLLEREPEHSAARELLARLGDERYEGPAPRHLPPEEETTAAAAAEAALQAEVAADLPGAVAPLRGDECIAIPVDRVSLFVYWSLASRSRARFEATPPPGGLVLRLVIVAPEWNGPRSMLRDVALGATQGDVLVSGLPAGAVVRAAIGWTADEAFHPLAHSPALESPAAEGAVQGGLTLVRWTLKGSVPVADGDRDAPAIERALEAARARAT